MKKYFKNKTIKIIALVLVCITALGLVGGITVSVASDTKKISASVFSRGGLDENGKYVKTNKTLYTEEAFGCIGLRVEPDFEANLTYDVYYYDYKNNLIEIVPGLSDVYDVDYPLAKMCRIVIHPEIPSDVSEKDFEVGYFEVRKIAKTLKITVDKNQDYLYSDSGNFYDEDNVTDGQIITVTDGKATVTNDATMKTTNKIEITDQFEKYDIFVRSSSAHLEKSVSIIATSADSVKYTANFDLTAANVDEWCRMTVEVKKFEEADYLRVSLPSDAECYIFGYND